MNAGARADEGLGSDFDGKGEFPLAFDTVLGPPRKENLGALEPPRSRALASFRDADLVPLCGTDFPGG